MSNLQDSVEQTKIVSIGKNSCIVEKNLELCV